VDELTRESAMLTYCWMRSRAPSSVQSTGPHQLPSGASRTMRADCGSSESMTQTSLERPLRRVLWKARRPPSALPFEDSVAGVAVGQSPVVVVGSIRKIWKNSLPHRSIR
jgi:hypothetical protein